MRQLIESVVLEGRNVRVTARERLPVDPRALTVAAAIRVFERYPALGGFFLTAGSNEVNISREEVDRLIGPDGFARLKDPESALEVLERAIQQYLGEEPEPGDKTR
ncbi:MAG: hypothetical protein HY002_03930 [Candidatus Rokubacteria bacterium]|nr:hypothetical protein [Candidatus Rokubacteria bacterium]